MSGDAVSDELFYSFYDWLEIVPDADKLFRRLNERYNGCCEILTAMKSHFGI